MPMQLCVERKLRVKYLARGDPFRCAVERTYATLFLDDLLLVGCSGGAGLEGCTSGESRPFDRTSTNLIENSVHGGDLYGYDFVYANRESIVAQVFQVDDSGWANLRRPPSMEVEIHTSLRDLSVGFTSA